MPPKRWRTLWIQTAFFVVLWLAVVFVFATEFYLTAREGPVRISWIDAARNSFHDWLPWIFLLPLVVALAGQFRVDRFTWRRSLLIHLPACLVVAFVYEALQLLATPASPMGGPVFATSHAMATGFQSFSVSTGAPPPPSAPFVTTRNGLVVGFAGVPPMAETRTGFVFGFRDAPHFNRWTEFLRRSVLRTQFTVPIYWCIVCICWVMNHFQESREQERRALELEARLTQANLQALKMQLQPHFLFNALNAISSLIHENAQAADDMVGSLSQFLRMTLEMSTENEIPLSKELEFIDQYLEIQQTRFGDRLLIVREIDPRVRNALVPPLILQPVVENAVRYGVEAREAGGTVTIRAAGKGDILRLEVCDRGEGIKSPQRSGGGGIGLSNTRTRLQELYGEKHRLQLVTSESAGACVQIEIPFRLPEPQLQTRV